MRLAASVMLLGALAYACLGAYAGYRVARGIRNATASNVMVRTASHMMGRRAVERIALRQAALPEWLTVSPTFWWALRSSE